MFNSYPSVTMQDEAPELVASTEITKPERVVIEAQALLRIAKHAAQFNSSDNERSGWLGGVLSGSDFIITLAVPFISHSHYPSQEGSIVDKGDALIQASLENDFDLIPSTDASFSGRGSRRLLGLYFIRDLIQLQKRHIDLVADRRSENLPHCPLIHYDPSRTALGQLWVRAYVVSFQSKGTFEGVVEVPVVIQCSDEQKMALTQSPPPSTVPRVPMSAVLDSDALAQHVANVLHAQREILAQKTNIHETFRLDALRDLACHLRDISNSLLLNGAVIKAITEKGANIAAIQVDLSSM